MTISTPSEVETEIIIESSPEKIWTLLLDFEQYPNWHNYLSKVSGKLETGRFLKFETLDPEGQPAGTFRAKLLELEQNKELSWGGNALCLFRAKHYFSLVTIDDTHTKLIQGEYWKGLLGPKYGARIYKEVTAMFLKNNQIIKDLLETKT